MTRGPRSDDRTSTRPGAVRRTLEQPERTRRWPSLDLGAPWVSGVLGAVQALVFSLAVVVVPAIAMAVAANAQLSAATSGWTAAVPVAARLWLLGHGAPLVTGGATVTLVPLGITAVAVFAVLVSARRTIVATRATLWSAVATYVVGVLLVALATGSTDGLQLVSAVVGGLAVALLGLGWGLLAGSEPGPLVAQTRALVARVPQLVRVGGRGALSASAVLAVLAGLLTLFWVLMGWSTVGDVLSDLRLDTASSISLGVAQLAVLPNLAVLAVTWLSGPGFSVGSGTHFGPDFVTSGPLPAIPLLGALPAPSTGGGIALWAPVLVVVAGACGGWAATRRADSLVWWHVVPLAGLVGVGSGVLTAVMVGLASGVAGPGRLADVGASPVYLGGCVAAQTALGALLVLLATRAEVHSAVASAWRSVRGRGDVAADAAGAEGGAGTAPRAAAAEPGAGADDPATSTDPVTSAAPAGATTSDTAAPAGTTESTPATGVRSTSPTSAGGPAVKPTAAEPGHPA